MKHFATQLLKKVLKRYNRTVCYTSYSITGCHFPDDLREVVRSDSPICLDVGAHWGETVREFQQIFASPSIHAIEPSASNCEKLRLSCDMKRVRIHQMALGANDEKLSLNLYPDTVLHSFLPVAPAGPQGSHQVTGTEEVRVTKLDTFVAENNIPHIDLLKIDTQGYELAVLQGASESLARGVVKAILLEVNFSGIYTGQPSFGELLETLHKHGFGFVDMYQKARIGQVLSWCNALFVQSKPSIPHG